MRKYVLVERGASGHRGQSHARWLDEPNPRRTVCGQTLPEGTLVVNGAKPVCQACAKILREALHKEEKTLQPGQTWNGRVTAPVSQPKPLQILGSYPVDQEHADNIRGIHDWIKMGIAVVKSYDPYPFTTQARLWKAYSGVNRLTLTSEGVLAHAATSEDAELLASMKRLFSDWYYDVSGKNIPVDFCCDFIQEEPMKPIVSVSEPQPEKNTDLSEENFEIISGEVNLLANKLRSEQGLTAHQAYMRATDETAASLIPAVTGAEMRSFMGRYVNLHGRAQSIYKLMKEFADTRGYLPSVDAVAHFTRCDSETPARYITRLREEGYVIEAKPDDKRILTIARPKSSEEIALEKLMAEIEEANQRTAKLQAQAADLMAKIKR